eukprot:CAMPEP_0206317970 /NCGR_PEP_ID=MMETSP0106_2-20121207/16921_1 /ASSEMBLY_ACC=CAM_ASM_000206 /TAXON_ID=81532 /ORGANISM="Acanthoeca-like sp., Strain 10tr" /LENGTH=190 /DNA_ID=CAMNT_0053749601 /DNA_START=3 /DNA_END=575 /DNA_ORIENTATION=+
MTHQPQLGRRRQTARGAAMSGAVAGAVTPVQIGVNIARKAIVLDYTVPDAGFPQKRRRFMPVRATSTQEAVQQLKSRHGKFLAGVPHTQLASTVEWFLVPASRKAAGGTGGALKKSAVQLSDISAENVDLNKFDDDKLAEVKEAMEQEFEQRAKGKGSVGYQYDVKKTFTPVEESGWDDTDSDPVDEVPW